MDTRHSPYHREKAISNLIQLQDHLREHPCPECIDKHALASVAYIDEENATNNQPNPELVALSERVREIRRRLQEIDSNSRRRLSSTV